MLIASNRGVGDDEAFPDACLTPTGTGVDATIPYTNDAQNAAASSFSANVMVCGMNALNQGSTVPSSNGDEAGTDHPTKCGAAAFSAGNPVVYVNGLPAINLSCASTGNNMNAPVGAVTVPSSANVLMTLRAGAPPLGFSRRPVRAFELDAIYTALAGPPLDRVSVRRGVVRVRARVISPLLPGALARLARGAHAMVLDLRGAPGGDLLSALRVIATFAGPVTRALGIEGAGSRITLGIDAPARTDCALEILVDGRTASAAEIVAGCLLRLGRARVEGGATYGKGSVQRLERGPLGEPWIATVGHVRFLDGGALDAVGIT